MLKLIKRNPCLSKLLIKKHKSHGQLCIHENVKTIINIHTCANLKKNNTQEQNNLFKTKIENGPSLKSFIQGTQHVNIDDNIHKEDVIPYLNNDDLHGQNRKVFFEVFGCQMNVNDTEVVWSILKSNGYIKTDQLSNADVILVMTCSIRENAEGKVWERLRLYNSMKQKNKKYRTFPLKVGILGCMAERLKTSLLEKEKVLDLVAGPDSYKDLPKMLALTYTDQTAINVILSLDETYADITPVRLNENSPSAYVSIMRGCNNMCTYCIVPFTRGRERSRPIASILDEVRKLSDQGVKEVTLLGQNVNSYIDKSTTSHTINKLSDGSETKLAKGFKTVYKPTHGGLRFADLLDQVSRIDPNMRIRFTSPHPKDFPDEVLHLIRERKNICNSIHLPAQSGNNEILELMRRGYTREAYLDLVEKVRSIIPGVHLSSDFIAGFCGETEEQFEETLSLIDIVKYHVSYLFAYSMREKTTAHRRYKNLDNLSKEIKNQRVFRMTNILRKNAEILNSTKIGSVELVLVESLSKKSTSDLAGRIDGNVKVNFPDSSIPAHHHTSESSLIHVGDYIAVLITESSSQALRGVPLYHTSLVDYSELNNHKFLNRNYYKEQVLS